MRVGKRRVWGWDEGLAPSPAGHPASSDRGRAHRMRARNPSDFAGKRRKLPTRHATRCQGTIELGVGRLTLSFPRLGNDHLRMLSAHERLFLLV